MVRNIRGVTGITNNLTVALRRRRRASAADTEAEIEEAFRRSADVDAAHLRVKVTDHTAELYGEVHSLAEAAAASEAAASAPWQSWRTILSSCPSRPAGAARDAGPATRRDRVRRMTIWRLAAWRPS